MDIYRFIFQFVTNALADETKESVECHKKVLSDTKLALEQRLTAINNFYKIAFENDNVLKKQTKNDFFENRMMSIYLYDQNAVMTQLINNIGVIQEQILNTYNTRTTIDMFVSDLPVNLPKYIELMLVVIAAFFLAFLGVFIAGFVVNLKIRR